MTLCSSCGKEVADNFCSNCGKSAVAEGKKENQEQGSNEEFLEKYDESEILDHINEMIKAHVGRKDRLESLHSLISEGKELDDVNVQYLKDCSDKFNSKQKRKKVKQSDDIKSKEGTPVKKTGTAKDAAIGFGVIIVIIAIIVGVVAVLLPGGSDTASNEDLVKVEKEIVDNPIQNELDPMIIQKIKNEFPILLQHHKKVLKDCENVKTFQDYVNSLSRLGGKTMKETISEFEDNHTKIFWTLSNQGYDEHPEIKSLFKETEDTSLQVLYCLDDLYAQYSLEFLK